MTGLLRTLEERLAVSKAFGGQDHRAFKPAHNGP
jgi:hypothetical protein